MEAFITSGFETYLLYFTNNIVPSCSYLDARSTESIVSI